MKIALIGASGFIGGNILREALAHGHQVTGIVRHPEKLEAQKGLTALKCDVFDVPALTGAIKGHDVVVSAYKAPGEWTTQAAFDDYVNSYAAQAEAVKAAGVPRFLVVGGAASLKLEDGTELIDSPLFPPQFLANKYGILGLREVFHNLKKETGFDWGFFSPAAIIYDGERTGQFRWGTDKYFTDEKGESRISVQDYAVAMVEEIEHPKYHQTRFTVAY